MGVQACPARRLPLAAQRRRVSARSTSKKGFTQPTAGAKRKRHLRPPWFGGWPSITFTHDANGNTLTKTDSTVDKDSKSNCKRIFEFLNIKVILECPPAGNPTGGILPVFSPMSFFVEVTKRSPSGL